MRMLSSFLDPCIVLHKLYIWELNWGTDPAESFLMVLVFRLLTVQPFNTEEGEGTSQCLGSHCHWGPVWQGGASAVIASDAFMVRKLLLLLQHTCWDPVRSKTDYYKTVNRMTRNDKVISCEEQCSWNNLAEQLSLIAVKKKKSWRLFAAVSMDCYIHAKAACQEVLLTPLKPENMAMISWF